MKTTVYIDSLFALNLIINYLLLLVTARIQGQPILRRRLLLGALLGAAYAVAVFFPAMDFLLSFLAKMLCAAAMVAISFGVSKRVYLRSFLIFMGVSIALGGAVFGLSMLTGGKVGALQNGVVYLPVNMPTVLLAAAATYFLLGIVMRRAGKHSGQKDIVRAEIILNGRKVSFSALVDTGNTLTDPLTSAPVMVADPDTALMVLPRSAASLITRDSLRNPVGLMEDLSLVGEGSYFRLIPYQAVGVESGMLLGFRPDEAFISGKRAKGLIVALSPTRVSDGGAYTALAGVM